MCATRRVFRKKKVTRPQRRVDTDKNQTPMPKAHFFGSFFGLQVDSEKPIQISM